ncbi:MAG: 3-methyl-2-oxobutanoate hydroxymethyltransferase, partial [Elusimicrobiota bacterium]|nr:3-methyl-2-oxobutanoate hydroxymethyltransferase [Elusimicrobiota bacterium]
MVRKTVVDIAKKKENNENISALTCYDYNMAKLLSSQGIDILLIGDSLGNVKLGFENTIPVTVDDMLIHVKSVVRGNCGSLVVADMPFMSYEVNIEEAVR